MSPKADTYKPSILASRSAKKSGGLGGAKKSGSLGAQKVKANFDDLESAALKKDKEAAASTASQGAGAAKGGAPMQASITSMSLAYTELSLDEKRREEKMKTMDPKKKEQVRSTLLMSGFL